MPFKFHSYWTNNIQNKLNHLNKILQTLHWVPSNKNYNIIINVASCKSTDVGPNQMLADLASTVKAKICSHYRVVRRADNAANAKICIVHECWQKTTVRPRMSMHSFSDNSCIDLEGTGEGTVSPQCWIPYLSITFWHKILACLWRHNTQQTNRLWRHIA